MNQYSWPHILSVFVFIPACMLLDVIVWEHPPFLYGLFMMQPIYFLMTIFTHRYFAHRAFEMSRASERYFGFLSATIFQNDPAWWASNHRKHHAHADTAADVHSPHTQKFWDANLLWYLRKSNLQTDRALVGDLLVKKDLKFYNDHPFFAPVVMSGLVFCFFYAWLYYYLPHSGLDYYLTLYKYSLHWTLWLYWVPAALGLVLSGFTNTMIHSWGFQDYDNGDQSRNSFLLAFLMAGEGWHNNHHKYPRQMNFGHKWWQIDQGYWAYRVLKFFRLVN